MGIGVILPLCRGPLQDDRYRRPDVHDVPSVLCVYEVGGKIGEENESESEPVEVDSKTRHMTNG